MPRRSNTVRPEVAARRRPWLIAAVVSVGFHASVAGSLLILARRSHIIPPDLPTGTVELLMVEKKGNGAPVPPVTAEAEPQPVAPPQQPQPPDKTPAPRQATESHATAMPSKPDDAGERIPPLAEPSPPTEVKVAEQPKPVTPPATKQQPLDMDLDGTDSESNAVVMGSNVIPASPDDRFRNRPPIYPYEAALRGEHGRVVLIIHVSDRGAAIGADLGESSGVASLDQAAMDAVMKWHFRPAMKDGRTVPFDMPVQFTFRSN